MFSAKIKTYQIFFNLKTKIKMRKIDIANDLKKKKEKNHKQNSQVKELKMIYFYFAEQLLC